jgi:hypothetical protein
VTSLRGDEEPSGGRVASEEGVDERDRLLLVAGHQVPVQIECDLDACVTHVGRNRSSVHPGRDQDAGEGVSTFVEADRLKAAFLQAVFADRRMFDGVKGVSGVEPKTYPST